MLTSTASTRTLTDQLRARGTEIADTLTGFWRADPPHGTDATLVSAAATVVAVARALLPTTWRDLTPAEVQQLTDDVERHNGDADDWVLRVLAAACDDEVLREHLRPRQPEPPARQAVALSGRRRGERD